MAAPSPATASVALTDMAMDMAKAARVELTAINSQADLTPTLLTALMLLILDMVLQDVSYTVHTKVSTVSADLAVSVVFMAPDLA